MGAERVVVKTTVMRKDGESPGSSTSGVVEGVVEGVAGAPRAAASERVAVGTKVGVEVGVIERERIALVLPEMEGVGERAALALAPGSLASADALRVALGAPLALCAAVREPTHVADESRERVAPVVAVPAVLALDNELGVAASETFTADVDAVTLTESVTEAHADAVALREASGDAVWLCEPL